MLGCMQRRYEPTKGASSFPQVCQQDFPQNLEKHSHLDRCVSEYLDQYFQEGEPFELCGASSVCPEAFLPRIQS